MTRPRVPSETERRARLRDSLSSEEREAIARREAYSNATAEERFKAGLGNTPVENHLLQSLTEREYKELTTRPDVAPEELRGILRAIGADQALAEQLIELLSYVQYNYNRRRRIQRASPTPGEMRAIFDKMLKPAAQLRDLYNSLPAGLLLHVTVPLTEIDSPALGAILNALVPALEREAKKYEPQPGKARGERAAAQYAARSLINFMNRRAPGAPDHRRREFVFRSIRALGIPCPDLDKNPGEFFDWFEALEAEWPPPYSRPSEQGRALMAKADQQHSRPKVQITFL